MRKHPLLIVCLALLFAMPAHAADDPRETVVILHGIALKAERMGKVEAALQEKGYDTLAITYPSTTKTIDEIAVWLHEKHLTKEFWNKAEKVHFVTHSMGGLVARRYLEKYRQTEKLGRVVMLAPPHGGSEVADTIHNLPPYKWYYGPAGEELTTAAQAQNTDKPYYELGIIAGTKEWPYIVAAFVVPGKSDGRVSVENTKIEGMTDHVTVNGTHTFIMDKPEVHAQIVHFLGKGEFEREKQ